MRETKTSLCFSYYPCFQVIVLSNTVSGMRHKFYALVMPIYICMRIRKA